MAVLSWQGGKSPKHQFVGVKTLCQMSTSSRSDKHVVLFEITTTLLFSVTLAGLCVPSQSCFWLRPCHHHALGTEAKLETT